MKIGGIAFLGLALVGGFIFIQVVGARHADNPSSAIWQAREMLHGRVEDHFGSSRILIWQESIPTLTNRPILGSGPSTFHLAISEGFQQYSFDRYGIIFDTPHNIFLQTAITLGLPALIAFLTLIASLFWSSLKIAFERPILLAFGAATLAYLAQGFFQVDTPIDRPLLWIMLGIMASEIWRFKIEHSQVKT